MITETGYALIKLGSSAYSSYDQKAAAEFAKAHERLARRQAFGSAVKVLATNPGVVVGGVRSRMLSSPEEAALKSKYNLSEEANLPLRNATRGSIGYLAGTAAGMVPIAALSAKGHGGSLAEARKAMARNPGAVALLTAPTALLGAYLATNKYSSGAGKQALKEQTA